MSNVNRDDEVLLSAWHQHINADLVLKDAEAALAIMTESTYVLLIRS